jgi:hypothetical protein
VWLYRRAQPQDAAHPAARDMPRFIVGGVAHHLAVRRSPRRLDRADLRRQVQGVDGEVSSAQEGPLQARNPAADQDEARSKTSAATARRRNPIARPNWGE